MLDRSPKVSEQSPMTAAAEARDLIVRIAGPQPLGASVKGVLRLVARKTGLGDRRIRAFWNKEARSILSTEMDRLRQVSALEEANAALREINTSIARAEDALAVRPADAAGAMADAQGQALRVPDRPVASRD